jgi:HlyD family secretion protein
VFIRAGYSANADIVLEEKKQVLALREALIQYDHDKPFVEVETTPQTFVRHDAKLGLSDGIKVEVLSGVAPGDRVKIPDNAGPAAPPAGSGAGSGSGAKPAAKK